MCKKTSGDKGGEDCMSTCGRKRRISSKHCGHSSVSGFEAEQTCKTDARLDLFPNGQDAERPTQRQPCSFLGEGINGLDG
jgi:hypothetical protein